jgi:hypothetical protein
MGPMIIATDAHPSVVPTINSLLGLCRLSRRQDDDHHPDESRGRNQCEAAVFNFVKQ